jgi:conjugal transfer pilus assembly protein TraK
LPATEDPGIYLPAVPREVLLAVNETPARIRHVSAKVIDAAGSESEEVPAATLSLGPKTIRVAPGTTAIVEVAIDHLNRIVTPFSAPQVRTVSPATTQVDGNAVYVATANEDPVSLFITEKGDTATAISLTLAPRHIPPREVRLVLTGGVVRAPAPSVKAPRTMARNDQPYVEHLATAFRALARNRVPPGFRLRKAGRKERVACRQPGLSVNTVQVLEGRGLRILAARARNKGKHPIALDEHRCGADAGTVVAAVAAWPKSRLAPGDQTEVYLALRPREPARGRDDRPSLLGDRR